MTTPFTCKTADLIKNLNFDALKIASYDCGSLKLINNCASTGKPLFISTGASFDNEIEETCQYLNKHNKLYSLLHCVTIYPTRVKDMHLARMNYLRLLNDKVGISTHPLTKELGINGDMIAVGLGADVVERHFTLENQCGKDSPVSINYQQLKDLKSFTELPRREQIAKIHKDIPNWKEYLGSAFRDLSKTELQNRDYYRGRFADKDSSGNYVWNWDEK